MRTRAVLYAVGFLLLLTLVAGCGGGGTSDELVGASLTLYTDTDAVSDKSASSRAIDVTSPLDEGGAVTVYNFLTGDVVASGTLDAEGKITLDEVPGGMTVVVVITGTQGEDPYRLSLIIPSVPIDGGEYEVDPATSIASEIIAQQCYRMQAVSQYVWNSVLANAQDWVVGNAGADFSLGGPIFQGSDTAFGQPDGLGDDAPDITVPTETNGVALAKNAVQQIKEAGLSVETIATQEPEDIYNLVDKDFMDVYSVLIARLYWMLRVLGGDMDYGGEQVALFDLTIGQGYTVDGVLDGNKLVLVDDANDIPGQITITAEFVETITVTAKLSGGIWTVTQTSSEDSAESYVATISADALQGPPGANPSFTGTISLEDSEFTTPVTFSGTVSATGTDPEHYTRGELNGTLTGPNVNSTGDLVATFPSSLPEGAGEFDSIYKYPTSVSLSNGTLSVTNSGTTIEITGNISATTVTIPSDGGYVDIVPRHLELDGTYSNSNSGVNFSGSIVGDWSNPPNDGPTTANGTLTMQGEVTPTGYATYSADLEFTKSNATINANIDLRAGNNRLQGTASTTLDTDGHATATSFTLTNQAEVVFDIDVNGSGEPSGTVKVSGTQVAEIGPSPLSGIRVTYDTDPVTYDDISL